MNSVNSFVAVLLLLLSVMLAYFVYLVHTIVDRQKRVERYLVTAARITSVCLGGLALPPVLQQLGHLAEKAFKEDPKDHNLDWVMAMQKQLHQAQQQAAQQFHQAQQQAQQFHQKAPAWKGNRRPSWSEVGDDIDDIETMLEHELRSCGMRYRN